MTPTPTTLSASELAEVLKRIAPTGREFGAARIARLLAAEHSVQTVRVNTLCSVGNISDQVSRGINGRIKDLGLRVACCKPAFAIYNKFNQPSGQVEWSWYRVAANDEHASTECPQDDRTRDSSAINDDYMQGDHLDLNEPITALDEALAEFSQQLASVDLKIEFPEFKIEFPEIDCLPAGDGTEVPGGSR